MGLSLPTMLISYYQYKEYEMDKKIRESRESRELRENEEEVEKKKYGCKYICETRCRSFVRNCRIRLENMNEEKQ